jgi:hypothetical protein
VDMDVLVRNARLLDGRVVSLRAGRVVAESEEHSQIHR